MHYVSGYIDVTIKSLTVARHFEGITKDIVVSDDTVTIQGFPFKATDVKLVKVSDSNKENLNLRKLTGAEKRGRRKSVKVSTDKHPYVLRFDELVHAALRDVDLEIKCYMRLQKLPELEILDRLKEAYEWQRVTLIAAIEQGKSESIILDIVEGVDRHYERAVRQVQQAPSIKDLLKAFTC